MCRSRPVVLLTLFCFMAACQHWVSLDPPVAETLAEHSGKVRLTDDDGERSEFDSTWVARDSGFGVTSSDTMTVPLSEIVEAEQRKTNVGLLVVVGGLSAGLIVVTAYCWPDEHGESRCQ